MFDNREQAGQLLADQLKKRGYGKDAAVLAIPRGGVVTGRVVARALGCPLDIVVTRKIPAPNQPELALGAVGPGGIKILDIGLIERSGASRDYVKNEILRLKEQIEKREGIFRGDKKPISLRGKLVIIVDDGIATGATVEAAARYLKTKKPKSLIVATPVASRDAMEQLTELVDTVVALETPEDFMAVGQWYRDFPQVTDEEVIELLQ